MKDHADILVIGGGASGMAAAITAAEAGSQVILLEGKDRVGKKLLSTGNGRCNFSNDIMAADCYYDADPLFVETVLGKNCVAELLEWLKNMGIDSKLIDGRYYPRSEQASAILDALRIRMHGAGVQVMTGEKVIYLRKIHDQFEAQTNQIIYSAGKVILATGSKAAPQTGSDGTGYVLARQVGLAVKKPVPALTSLKLNESYCKSWAGVRCDGSITLLIDQKETAHDRGQLQLTSYGVSGIPAFQVSRFASRALENGKEVKAVLSFLPDKTIDETVDYLMDRKEHIGEYRLSDYLLGLLPKNLAGVMIRLSGIDKQIKVSDLTQQQVNRFASLLTSLTVSVNGTGSFAQAQVCSGGVTLESLDPVTLECNEMPGLYIAGELMDVDGMCGGYNLQWAFSSGMRAGYAAASSSY